MSLRRLLVLVGPLLLSGCLYNGREQTDKMVCDLAAHPLDLTAGQTQPATGPSGKPATSGPVLPGLDVQTSALLLADIPAPPPSSDGIRLVNYEANELAQVPPNKEEIMKLFNIPKDLPGADAPPLPDFSRDPAMKSQQLREFYAKLPPLPEAPRAQPGPNGMPYTLADLQQIAAINSPTLRQAASDVEAARGNMIQAAAYPNPTLSYQIAPSNDGSTSAFVGFGVDQVIKTGGKLQLATAAALKNLENAELALKRARSDLSTQVRNAYFAVLVAEETVRVNRSLARFTDDVYEIQIKLSEGPTAAPYEPTQLQAQSWTVRTALYQAIQTYVYSWKQLVAVLGERQLPLSQVAGRIDSSIPYYDYDAVLGHVLAFHTDVLTARNGIDQARANLKLQQVTPIPDVDLSVGVAKDFAVEPKLITQTVSVGVPIPIWDQNKGAILAAEAALVRATEEPHRVETVLTSNLAAAYNNYTNNLVALEYYRRYILPDQIRAYQTIYLRRNVDNLQGVVFGDVVAAQQTLVTSMGAYLTILGQLWTSVTSVADFLQTDNLFQVGEPVGLPPLPDFEHAPGWPCCHTCAAAGGSCPAPAALVPGVGTVTPSKAGTAGPASGATLPTSTSPASTPLPVSRLPNFLPAEPAVAVPPPTSMSPASSTRFPVSTLPRSWPPGPAVVATPPTSTSDPSSSLPVPTSRPATPASSPLDVLIDQ